MGGVMFPKDDIWRSAKYLKWVKTLPSVVSGVAPAGDAHHIKVPGLGGTVKCCDAFAIPLTRGEHIDFHNIGRKTWERRHNICQKMAVLRTIEKALAEGILHD